MSVEQAPSSQDDVEPYRLGEARRRLLTLAVLDPWNPQFFMRLGRALFAAPARYRNAAVVLDLGPVAGRTPLNLAEFCRRLRQYQLVPVAVVNAGEAWAQMAANAGLAVFEDAGEAAPRAAAAPPDSRRTRVVEEPVRSGQQVYAPGGDLVVLSTVHPGAEVLADGHIHVYGALRGRALAGIRGDAGARVFCRRLEAELVSVAGVYAVSEALETERHPGAVQIRLDGETLVVEPLS